MVGSSAQDVVSVAQAGVDAPVADWLNPLEMDADPFPAYARLREQGPVVFAPALGRYLITSYPGCRVIETHPEITAHFAENSLVRALGGDPMLTKDDPEHELERKPINPALRPGSLKTNWAEVFRTNTRIYLNRMADVGSGRADLKSDFAAPLASKNLVDLLGFREVADEDMSRWSHAFIMATANMADDPVVWKHSEDAAAEVDGVLSELIPHLRIHPDSSITSALIDAGLPEPAVRNNVKLAISGGINEPQHALTSLVWALSHDPSQRELVVGGGDSWPAAFEEVLRWMSPIGFVPKHTIGEVVIEGIRIPAGSAVLVLLASGNRDESEFLDAARFDAGRPKKAHLAFGSGPHICAGMWPARIAIGQIALPMLYERFPDLGALPERPAHWHGWFFRGLTTFPVAW